MNRRSQSGIALVVTLVMLAIVTFMAVVFLGISRREKISVTVARDMTDAKLMAEAALARAQGEISARIISTTNPFNYDLLVSTNFINPGGYRRNVGANPTNVNYLTGAGTPLRIDTSEFKQNVANLQYDPRPPVYLPTAGGTNDFRFYLDLNRNGRYESNGFFAPVAPDGRFYDTNGFVSDRRPPQAILTNYFTGDPEWIGVLERAGFPHSESNRFIGRYAYVVLPAGKSLDLNFIHNNAKQLDRDEDQITRDGYLRNQGFASWELNLAGFLKDLNTNIWPAGSYFYNTNLFVSSAGTTFDDSWNFLRHRYLHPVTYSRRLSSFQDEFGVAAALKFERDGIDGYSDGPLALWGTPQDVDSPVDPARRQNRGWSGSRNPSGYFDLQDLFDADRTWPPFLIRLTSRPPLTQSMGTYDRYTFYRMLAQMGVDSKPAYSNRLYQADHRLWFTNRLHLNYQQEYPNAQTNFEAWPVSRVFAGALNQGPELKNHFFLQAADRLLRASLITNIIPNYLGGPVTNFFLGDRGGIINGQFAVTNVPVRPDFSVTNIQLAYIGSTNVSPPLRFWTTNNEYSSATHRLLQLAANILDATTNRSASPISSNMPTVLRPVFYKSATNIIIAGYVQETNTVFLNFPWMSLEEVRTNAPRGYLPALNVFGVPTIVGAKKGYPNFNEYSFQTALLVSRKLAVRKPNVADTTPDPSWSTNQMYVLGISNVFGMEGWNSYTQDFRRDFELRMTNSYTMALHHAPAPGQPVQLIPQTLRSGILSTTLTDNVWSNSVTVQAFNLIQTNFLFLTNSTYLSGPPWFVAASIASNLFENTPPFRIPEWYFYVTNRVTYVLIDRSANPPQVVDFVNLDNLVSVMDVASRLRGDTNDAGQALLGFGGGRSGAPTITEGEFWNTNRVRVGDPNSAPFGVTNQLGVSLGLVDVGKSVWREYFQNPISGDDKAKAIDAFRRFMGLSTTNKMPAPTNFWMEAPFTPTRMLTHTMSWQANDPLVHYFVDDLVDRILTDPSATNNYSVQSPRSALKPSNLGFMNERYNPWGGNPNKQSASDPRAWDYRLKDPMVRTSDDWDFPTNKFPNVGWLGRVHRGTPWQTMYLKSGMAEPLLWYTDWAANFSTHPTNDWKLVDLFTVAPNDNAARGLLGVNQTNIAAWSAVLSGVAVMTNITASPRPDRAPQFTNVFIQPSSPQLTNIVAGIIRTKLQQTNSSFVFPTLGSILATPELSFGEYVAPNGQIRIAFSPFLNLPSPEKTAQQNQIAVAQYQYGMNDVAMERIPQQILSLLKPDEPRVVIYTFGQSLRPAQNSIVRSASFYGLCTNYQITGESAAKATVRFEPVPYTTNNWRAVVERYEIMPPQ